MLTGLAPFAAVVLVSLVVLFSPESGIPSTLPPGIDKVIHMALFRWLGLAGPFSNELRYYISCIIHCIIHG